jgi:chaperone BCS1
VSEKGTDVEKTRYTTRRLFSFSAFSDLFGKWKALLPLTLYQVVLTLGGFGAASIAVTSLLKRKFVSRVYISSRDEAFHWLMFWLSQHEYSERANQFTVLTSKTHFDFSTHFFNASPTEKDKHKIPVKFIPAPGTHFIKFEGRLIWIHYQRQIMNNGNGSTNSNSMSQSGASDIQEAVVVSTIAAGPEFLRRFIMYTQDLYLQNKHGKTLVYVPDTFCDVWEPRICRQKRDPKTVILKDNIFQVLLDDAKRFLKLQTWYHERGIPFRRGYLIYGPPGTGKTSCVTALAGALDMNICMIHLSNKYLSDDKLSSLLLNTPFSSIILLEDIDHALDAAQNKQKFSAKSDEDEEGGTVTLAGLLNSLDGVIAQEGRLVFMTTNNASRLPPALVRPGRIDMSIHIDYATDEQIEQMFLNFYPNSPELASEFIKKLRSETQNDEVGPKDIKITTAAIQGLFLQYKDDPVNAVKNAKNVLNMSQFD